MPQLQQYIESEASIGIWQIEEDEHWFLEKMPLYHEERKMLSDIKGHRRLEWLASRYLLHEMSGRAVRGACLKDAYGKPYLSDSTYQISLSHSHRLAAVMASPQVCGVDIQGRVAKISRIAHKFVNEQEANYLSEHSDERMLQWHVIWGIKECLYKAHGRKKLNFKAHIHVLPFDKTGIFQAYLQMDDHLPKWHFNCRYRMIGTEYVLTSAVQAISLPDDFYKR